MDGWHIMMSLGVNGGGTERRRYSDSQIEQWIASDQEVALDGAAQ